MPSRYGISDRRPPASSTSRRSPAPKFSTATTVHALSVAIDAWKADQVGMVIFALFERWKVGPIDFPVDREGLRPANGRISFEPNNGGLAITVANAKQLCSA